MRQTVGAVPCRCELRIRRKRKPRGLLEEFRQRLERQVLPPHVERVEVGVPQVCDLLVGQGWADCRVFTDHPLRLALVLPGGRGKSTFLASLAKAGLSGREIVYVDELPGDLGDLSQEAEDLRMKAGRRVMLLIDHLDRLVEEDYFAFWLDQIRTLGEIKNLDLVVACRPEEYERLVKGSLPGFKEVKDGAGWVSDCHGITRSLVSGRPRARALEDALSGDPGGVARSALAVFACGLRQSRASATPLPQGSLQLAGREIALSAPDGRYRYVHDCVQDLFSASRLLHVLAGEDPSAAIRHLRELPRDVFRMLVELLNRDSEGALASAATRVRARSGLAMGLLEEATTQQWLYDTGRLHQALEAVEVYAESAPARSLEKAIGRKLSAHVQYGRASLRQLRASFTREEHLGYYENAVRQWTEAIAAVETSWTDAVPLRDQLRWLLALLADHLFLALTRIASIEELAPYARSLAGEMAGHVAGRQGTTRTAEPGWLGRLLTKYAQGCGIHDADSVWEGLDRDLTALRKAEAGGADYHGLDVRRGHLACHIGLHLLDHAFVPNLNRENALRHPTSVDRLRKAEVWYERSISRRERVLLKMESDLKSGRRTPGEAFGTLANGFGDTAHQYRGVFEALLFMLRSDRRPETLLAELGDAARRMEEAWTRAENALLPSERLPVYYHESVPFLAMGRAIRAALAQRSRAWVPSAADVENLVSHEIKELVETLPAKVEGAMRVETVDGAPSPFRKRLEDAIPGVCSIISAELGGPSRSNGART